MTKRTFNIEEVESRLTDNHYEAQRSETEISEIDKEDLPKKPPRTKTPKDIEGSNVIVKGPSYGDITVKVVKDGNKIDFYNFLITNEEKRQLKAKDDITDIPSYIHAALLKSGWYCTNWGEEYSTKAADYMITYGAILKHLEIENRLPEYLQDDEDPEEISLTATDIYISRLINSKSCKKELRQNLNTIISDQNVTPLTAITIHTANLQCETNSEIKALSDLEKVNDEDYIEIYSELAKNQDNVDVPEICPNFLPRYAPSRDGKTIWDKPLIDQGYFSLPYTPIKHTYIVNKMEFSKNNSEYIQVGVITENSTFYNIFRKVSKNECVAENTENGFPSIFCAAVLREDGMEIKNIPTPEDNKLSEIYKTLLDTYTKYIMNSNGLHDELIIKLVYTLTVFEKTYMALKLKEGEEKASYEHEDRIDKIEDEVKHLMGGGIREEYKQ